jgi:hypothetical protein
VAGSKRFVEAQSPLYNLIFNGKTVFAEEKQVEKRKDTKNMEEK